MAVRLAQDLSHFLQKLGLSVTRSLFKPVVHGSGQNRVLIEDAGPGMNLLQDLYMGMPPSMTRPLGVKPEGSKQDRVAAQSAKIEAGHVHLPKDAPWLHDFLNELLGVPHARHDDQVDSLSKVARIASVELAAPSSS